MYVTTTRSTFKRCAFSVTSPEFLAALIAGSRWIAHAYDPDANDRLIGFRASDLGRHHDRLPEQRAADARG